VKIIEIAFFKKYSKEEGRQEDALVQGTIAFLQH
jgi:hypothetical protein